MTTSEHEHEAAAPEVLFHRRGRVGHVVLNRPRAINALTHGMVVEITARLRDWADDDGVATVLLTGAGDRGLCAGGDIVSLYASATSGDGSAAAEFWADEYRLDALIARYPKPYVAIMDGIVLGGGIGVSAHGRIRVVTERSSIGMPETGIGFLPDVGGTYLLSHAPGETGTHLGLTAGSIGAGDAIALGFADFYVPSSQLSTLLDDLEVHDALSAVQRSAEEAPTSPLLESRAWIDEAYQGGDLTKILTRLGESDQADAAKAAAAIERKSPTSLRITLRALREAATMGSLRPALDMEYRLALRCHAGHDFVEGVRAQVIDKDRNPQWQPARIEDVDDDTVAGYFASLAEQELGLAPARDIEKETI